MRHLYFIRHGETDFNRQNIVQGGGVDSDLNETGREQGARFFAHYRDVPFDRVYCTQLKRTYQTVQPFEQLGHTITRIPELNELSWGVIEGAVASEDVLRRFDEVNRRWTAGDLDACVEGGESPRVGWQRAEAGIQRILSELPRGGRALVCIHGRISRIILSELLGYGMQHMNQFPHHNTALNHVRFLPDGRCTVARMNDIRHLA
jgi:probable phosphoglycerate mutase